MFWIMHYMLNQCFVIFIFLLVLNYWSFLTIYFRAVNLRLFYIYNTKIEQFLNLINNILLHQHMSIKYIYSIVFF